MKKHFADTLEKVTSGIIATLILLLLNLVLYSKVQAQSAAAAIDVQGYRIEYTGRTYHMASNTTGFNYNVKRGLLAKPLSKLDFLLTGQQLTNPLVGVNTLLGSLLGVTTDLTSNLVGIQGSPLPALSSNVELKFLGDVPEDSINVLVQAGTNNPTVKTSIKGPRLLGILNPGGGSGTGSILPECITDLAQPIIAKVGQALSVPLSITGNANSLLTLNYNHLPIGASFSVPSGSSVQSNGKVSLNWTPQASDVGVGHLLPLEITDALNNLSLCNVLVDVLEDKLPKLNVDIGAQTCQGVTTRISLDASASFDPEGRPLTYKWSSDCDQGTILDTNSNKTTINLLKPGAGTAQNCDVRLEVSDGVNAEIDLFPLSIGACNVTCPAQDKDLCGVCNGSNLCVDCAGVVNGGKTVDRCGVCGGSNACIDCQGVPSGQSLVDVCGVCGGDDRSCLSCQSTDYNSLLTELDSAAAAQARVILNSIKRNKPKKFRKTFKDIEKRAHVLHNKNWSLVWTLASSNATCSHYIGCSSANHSDKIQEYKNNAAKLLSESNRLSKLYKKIATKSAKGIAKKIARNAKRTYDQVVGNVGNYPTQTNSCS